MKLQPDKFTVQSIQGHGPGWIAVDGLRIDQSVIIGSRGERQPWPCTSFASLQAGHFDLLAPMAPEVVLFGSGHALRFVHPSWLTSLARARIGVETMDTAAACRTYNILAGEGRHVVAALLLETP